jgi:hypothetical protein
MIASRRPPAAIIAAFVFALLLQAPFVPKAAAAPVGGGPVAGAWYSHTGSAMVLSARPAAEGAWLLEARLRGEPATPIGEQDVVFSATIDFLGKRPVQLGDVRTDSSGTARLTFRPTWNGPHHVVARVPFDDGTVLSNEAIFDVSGAQTPLAVLPVRLPVIGALVGPAAALVVVTVWGVLLLLVVRVVVGISRAAAPAVPGGGGGGRRGSVRDVDAGSAGS